MLRDYGDIVFTSGKVSLQRGKSHWLPKDEVRGRAGGAGQRCAGTWRVGMTWPRLPAACGGWRGAAGWVAPHAVVPWQAALVHLAAPASPTSGQVHPLVMDGVLEILAGNS